mmetsp:Transcript_20303/g.37962  ORF Transcript_20303/g.37962 Transcript_20303/m.37962 type:complete len:363 (+) Transcript_20303:1-1089(+)
MEDRKLQMMDAHYLYRGLAFAIRQEAPGLETPEERRINFCRNNGESLNKASPGFTLNGEVGKLPTLADFFECNKHFNMTDLLMDYNCPLGKRRHPIKGHCKDCIPGMKGKDCQTFKYGDFRHQVGSAAAPSKILSDSTATAQLAAGWLAREAYTKQRAQHIFELGPTASMHPKRGKTPGELAKYLEQENLMAVSNLLHDVRDVIAVDPIMISQPVWLDHNEANSNNIRIETKRFLPCSMKDVISLYAPLLDMKSIDTFVCLACNDMFLMIDEKLGNSKKSQQQSFSEYLESLFPSIQTIVLGIRVNPTSNEDALVSEAMETLLGELVTKHSWKVHSDVTMITAASTRITKDSETTRLTLISR